MQFDFSSTTPLFRQVAHELSESIAAGRIGEGDQVPSTTEISVAYNINPATVLKGMNLLVSQGFIEKRRGLGMFVTTGAQERARKAQRDDLMEHQLGQLVAQAKALGISSSQLKAAIEREYQ
ncbi:GntR family transcriptional regulator [Bombiscardovia apis]|uniref:GntR family transcriptional regulator n=1 Tax=Bombiscardovia apis TaxID=2932182 RepID=A0ABN6SG70_9BIFI|nr:GntR family transcriptional regulator [Bombiscardovia apis]BDR54971.1 GntR family transcriptional regulator [Bombiscardovia apis]